MRRLTFFILYFSALFVCNIMLIYSHELIHVEIFRSYGIDSHIEWFSYWDKVVTVADSSCPTETCEVQHNMNELTGYYLMSMINVYYIMYGVILLRKWD